MAFPQTLLRYVCSIVLLLGAVQALKFDLMAQPRHDPSKDRCIRNFVAKDTLVVVTAIVGGYKGDGQIVNMRVRDAVGNEYGRAKDIAGEQRQVFTSHADAAFDVCFENTLSGSKSFVLPLLFLPPPSRSSADCRPFRSRPDGQRR